MGLKEEHDKAEKEGYKEELEKSIQKYGGTRLKEEDKKLHEKEKGQKDNYSVEGSNTTVKTE